MSVQPRCAGENNMFVTSYQGVFLRFLHSFFVQAPLTLWFKYLSWPLPQNVLEADYDVLWGQARGAIATAPFPTTSSSGGPMHAADPRALGVQAAGVTLIPVPDEPIANL